MKLVFRSARWLTRSLAVVLLVIAGSTLLVRFAPGYFSDAREMDARFARMARAESAAERQRSGQLGSLFRVEIADWVYRAGGTSRQFGIPVAELIRPRLAVSGVLLLQSVLLGWSLALCASITVSIRRNGSLGWQSPATILLAVPVAALATLCRLTGVGGPVLVMALLLAARDFKFLYRAVRKAWFDSFALQARAQGIGLPRLMTAHVLPAIAPDCAALMSLSIVTALSALVPVEVIFNIPGVGQLAWNAALNRDLPVLLAVTIIMAIAVVLSGLGTHSADDWKRA